MGLYLRFHKQTTRGYHQTECVLCGRKAIYHCAGKGYCRTHKEHAVTRLRMRGAFQERRARSFEAEEKAFDTVDLNRRKFAAYMKLNRRRT